MFFNADAQYYYKDLIAAEEIIQLKKSYTDYNIKTVTSAKYSPDGNVTFDFKETQEYEKDKKELRFYTTENRILSLLTYKFDELGRIESITDSSFGVKSYSFYKYDNSGKPEEIRNKMIDSSGTFFQTETHFWIFKKNSPEKMWRIINNTDSLEIRFVKDERDNIIEEQNFKNNKLNDRVYYYYDDKNRLTDIVRYNIKAKKLLPDFMFEYDENNRVIQKISTTSNRNIGYLIWRYLYNEKGLKIKEALYDREKKLLGKIDFFYN